MLEFFLASGNSHKAQEFAALLPSDIFSIQAAPQKLDVEETGKSFSENALLKAQSYYRHFKRPTLADDSGLSVEALPDDLGIYSARFGGEGLTDRQRAELLLQKLEGVENRKAYFTCVLCFYLSEQEIFFFEGRLDGQIGHELRGEHGFGYDPVFHPMGELAAQSIAQVPEWKDQNSHRAQACQYAQRFFRERVCQNP